MPPLGMSPEKTNPSFLENGSAKRARSRRACQEVFFSAPALPGEKGIRSRWPSNPILPAKRLLRQLSEGTALNKLGLEGSPPGVVEAQHPFQRVQFKRTQVFFREVAEL